MGNVEVTITWSSTEVSACEELSKRSLLALFSNFTLPLLVNMAVFSMVFAALEKVGV